MKIAWRSLKNFNCEANIKVLALFVSCVKQPCFVLNIIDLKVVCRVWEWFTNSLTDFESESSNSLTKFESESSNSLTKFESESSNSLTKFESETSHSVCRVPRLPSFLSLTASEIQPYLTAKLFIQTAYIKRCERSRSGTRFVGAFLRNRSHSAACCWRVRSSLRSRY